jgi:hypothetical protein
MQAFHTESVVEKDGKIHLGDVPFSEGQVVHVFISPVGSSATLQSLKGSVLKYEDPFATVAGED